MTIAVFHVLRHPHRSLRLESEKISEFNAYLIRSAFWSVLLVGLVDKSLALMEVEQVMAVVFGKALALDLVSQTFRGQYIHMPLIVLSFVIAALLLVVVELLIAMFRFIFTYEQTYMSDLARFWYAALFLLACVDTLREEGHVRVDVLYTRFTSKTKRLEPISKFINWADWV